MGFSDSDYNMPLEFAEFGIRAPLKFFDAVMIIDRDPRHTREFLPEGLAELIRKRRRFVVYSVGKQKPTPFGVV